MIFLWPEWAATQFHRKRNTPKPKRKGRSGQVAGEIPNTQKPLTGPAQGSPHKGNLQLYFRDGLILLRCHLSDEPLKPAGTGLCLRAGVMPPDTSPESLKNSQISQSLLLQSSRIGTDFSRFPTHLKFLETSTNIRVVPKYSNNCLELSLFMKHKYITYMYIKYILCLHTHFC